MHVQNVRIAPTVTQRSWVNNTYLSRLETGKKTALNLKLCAQKGPNLKVNCILALCVCHLVYLCGLWCKQRL